MFGLVDYFAPEFSNRHKLQVNRWQPSAKRILEAAGISFRNNLISAVVQWVLVHELGKGKTLFDLSPKLPSLWEITWQVCDNIVDCCSANGDTDWWRVVLLGHGL